MQRPHLQQPQKRIGIGKDEFENVLAQEDHRKHNILILIIEMLSMSGKPARQ